GDELIAVFNHAECVERIKQTFTKYIDDYNANSKKPYKVSASVGVFTGNACDFTNFDRLFRNADELMYEEKTAKKQNRIL
ncbi:MAG: diguanylate cyclase domain-containing protein, partial [Oscillospiraceae bacterium]